MSLVSIIVPIYNVANYLERCLESLICQTLQDIEIILVNDGSTDDASEVICRNYAEKDARIQLIHQENAGVSAARNNGLAHAHGEYITFVDGDDYVAPEMVELLYKACEKAKAPIGICEYYEENEKGITVHSLDIEKEVLEQGEIRSKILVPMIGSQTIGKQDEIFRGYVWRILYSKKFLICHGLRFESEREILIEDLWFNTKAYYFANRIALVKKPLYYYVYRLESLTKGYRFNYFQAALALNQCLTQFAREQQLELLLAQPLATRKEMFLWDSIYNTCHPKNSADRRKKVEGLRQICQHEEMQGLVKQLPLGDSNLSYKLKCYLVKKEYYGLLYNIMTGWQQMKQLKGKVRACYEN